MAIKKVTIRNYTGTTWDELYPKTSADQIITSSDKQFITADQITKLEGIEVGATKYVHPATHPVSMITGLATVATSGSYNDLTNKPALGTSATRNTGTTSGTLPLIGADGKLDASVIPAVAISDTFVVASQTAMLALTAQVGDVAIRSDQSTSYILKTEPATTLANWQELLTPNSPVTSVAGKTGAVTLTAADVGLGNVTNEAKTTMFANPAFTGVPSAPTAAVATNTTQLATTAYVKLQGYATLASPALTGTPTAPTAAAATNNTQIATTAFVKTAVAGVSSTMPKIVVSAVEPTTPTAGDFWYEEI